MKLPIYMDHHATTPVDPRVLEAMLPTFSETFGNAASRNHSFGWKAEELVENGRQQIADSIGASSKEIVFTSGATESDNLALKGVAAANTNKGNHIITCVTEHKAILDSAKYLERQGIKATYLPVDRMGILDPALVEKSITDETILVSVMYANNELGTIHPIKEIGEITRKHGVLFHCDAVQALGKIPVQVDDLNVDLLSMSAHKMYGPKGVGALYVRRKPPAKVGPTIHGGGHERGMRSGTLNVSGIVGFGKACEIAAKELEEESARLLALRDRLWNGLQANIHEIYLNGHPTQRLPNNLNVSFAYVEGEGLLLAIRDVAVSSGSACTSASLRPSYVLHTLGVGDDLAHSSIRFGLGRFNTEEEVDYVIEKVAIAVTRLRELSPLYDAAKRGE